MTNSKPKVTFYYDIVCPYAFMAATQVEDLATEAQVDIHWQPVLLGGIFKNLGSAIDPNLTLSPSKHEHTQNDILRQSKRHGLDLKKHPNHPVSTLKAMRLLTLCPQAQRPKISLALYEAYWLESQDISDPKVLELIANKFNLEIDAIEQEAVKNSLFEATKAASDKGVFGVPTFEVGKELYWGADRLNFVRKALGLQTNHRYPKAAPGQTLNFYYDFSSPFAFLGYTQIENFAKEVGVTLKMTPILLGALFKDVGVDEIPIFAMSEPKRNAVFQDFKRWANWWDVPFKFNDAFPMNSVNALRVAIVEPKVTHCLFKAIWTENKNLSDKKVLAQVLQEHGFDAEALLKKTQDQAIKDTLKQNTKEAYEAGVFGLPAFKIDNAPIVWGQDRFDLVADLLAD